MTKVLLAVLLALGLGSSASAQIKTVTYQGRLTDGGGPANGSFDLTFRIFDAASGGSGLWQETLPGVAVTAGLFTVVLGQTTPLQGVFAGSPRWLEIEVQGTVLLPRQEMTSAPGALHAAVAELSGDFTGSLAGEVTGTQGATLVSGAVAANAPGTVVRRDALGDFAAGTIAANLDGNAATATVAGDSDRLDGFDSLAFQRRYAQVAIVAQNGTNKGGAGFYNDPALALADSAVWCGTPSATNPCLVKIMPGVYSVPSGLVMLPFIDIEGAGRGVTRITRAGDQTVTGNEAEIRQLTIENTGGGTVDTFGVLTPVGTAAPSLQDVSIVLSGAVSCSGCAVTGIDSVGKLALRNVSIDIQTSLTCTAGCVMTGINFRTNIPGGLRLVRDVDIAISGVISGPAATVAQGIRLLGGGPGHLLERVHVVVTGSGSSLLGIDAFVGLFEIRDSVVTVTRSGGSGSTVGLDISMAVGVVANSDIAATGSATAIGVDMTLAQFSDYSVNHSRITGTGNTVRMPLTQLPPTLRIGATLLAGGPVDPGFGTVVCAGVYDESYTFYPNTCP